MPAVIPGVGHDVVAVYDRQMAVDQPVIEQPLETVRHHPLSATDMHAGEGIIVGPVGKHDRLSLLVIVEGNATCCRRVIEPPPGAVRTPTGK